MSFNSLLRLIAEGDQVRAGVVNRPLRHLDQNVRYLLGLLDAAAAGSTVYARRQTVEAEAAVGMPVYLDAAAAAFRRAVAAADVDQVTGVVSTSASSQVWGIVAAKHSATLADVLLFGLADVDISAAVVGPPAAGTYYLSGAAPGRLVAQRPPVSVPVLRRTPDGRVFVQPQFVDFLDRHVHYRFDLKCAPAGTHTQPTAGGLHAVADPDAGRRGWLPADHPAFAGKAPPGAVFGYNLAADPALAAAWPPVPLTSAVLEWSKGVSADVGFTGVPLGRDGLAVLDRNGVWWMSNCYGDVPWPVDYGTGNSASASDSVGAECPRLLAMELRLYFGKATFATDAAGVVLSVASNDARLRVSCYGDPARAATTGHLELDLDLDLVASGDAAEGHLAFKTFDRETATFGRGPVAEGLYTTASNVTLSGTATSTRTIASVPRTVHHGLVAVVVDPADTKELDVQLVRLDGAEESYLKDPPLMYLGFPAGDETEYRAKVHVPFDLAIPTPRMFFRFQVLGRAAGTLPQLTFSARVVPRPSGGLATPLDVPDDSEEFSLACTTAAAVTANQYVEAESDDFAVAAGDTVYFTVRRGAADGYAGEVGVLRQAAVVESGA